MEETLKKLEEQINELNELTKFIDKYGDPQITSEKLFYKRLEDGILSNISEANVDQLNMMKRSYRFKFYSEEYIDNLVKGELLKRSRRDKLNIINKNN